MHYHFSENNVFTTFSMHVDYIFSLCGFPFRRENRDSFHVHPRPKSLRNTLELILVLKTTNSLTGTF